MQLFSVSIREIETDLINYFRTNFPNDPAPIFPGSNVKNRYKYTPESWAELADELSTLPWMEQIGVVLIQDDMRNVSTIEELAVLISKHMHHVVAPQAKIKVTPLNTLMRVSGLGTSATAIDAKQGAKKRGGKKKARKGKTKKAGKAG